MIETLVIIAILAVGAFALWLALRLRRVRLLRDAVRDARRRNAVQRGSVRAVWPHRH